MPILARATELQVQESWRLNFKEWAEDLDIDQYLAREQSQIDTYPDPSLSQTNWVLLPDSGSQDILSACETLVRPCLLSYIDSEGQRIVKTGNGYGIASVYCRPEYRRRGYAGLMLTLLAQHLETDAGGLGGGLWSDIGPDYYARFGWDTHPSRMVALKVPSNHLVSRSNTDSWIERHQVKDVCDYDVRTITAEVQKDTTNKTLWSFLPTSEVVRWHHARMDYVYSLQSSDTIKNVGYRISDSAFVLWTLQFSSNDPVLYILRLRYGSVEDLRTLLNAAIETAVHHGMAKVVIWDKTAKEITGTVDGIEVVEQEIRTGSISALHVNGFNKGHSIEWLNNEKFCWC